MASSHHHLEYDARRSSSQGAQKVLQQLSSAAYQGIKALFAFINEMMRLVVGKR